MADMLYIGAQAANTYKTALDVTSHNVANVNTEGYSRQRAEISSQSGGLATRFSGGGSNVDSVMRIQADYIQNQLIGANGLMERYDEQTQLSKQVEGLVASNDEGMQSYLQGFFDSLQSVTDNPTSNSNRQLLIDEMNKMENGIANLSTIMGETYAQVNTQIGNLVDEINDRLKAVQAINEQVANAVATSSQLPNDLLDQRDQAILELSSYVDIKTYPQPNGNIDIFTANGRLPLLSDNTLTGLQAGLSPYTFDNRVEVYMNIGGQRAVVSDEITGGQLGGVLQTRTDMMDRAQKEMGVMLNGMVAAMNWQHYQGWDSNGDPGQNLFTPLAISGGVAANSNTGTEDGSNIAVSFNPNAGISEPPYTNNVSAATPPTNLDDQPQTYSEKQGYLQNALDSIAQFKARDYLIRSDGGAPATFSFFDYGTGEDLTSQATQVPAGSGQYQLDGLEFDLSSVNATGNGDSFLVKPHQKLLEQFQVALDDPQKIAARGQSPIPTDGPDADTAATIGESAPSPAAVGDNVNASNLSGFLSKRLLFADGNGEASESLLGGYSQMAANVGMFVRSSEIHYQAQQSVHDQVLGRRESLSGVSLDEEAANLMKFQQAYEASAQIIATSQSIFQVLMGVVRG